MSVNHFWRRGVRVPEDAGPYMCTCNKCKDPGTAYEDMYIPMGAEAYFPGDLNGAIEMLEHADPVAVAAAREASNA